MGDGLVPGLPVEGRDSMYLLNTMSPESNSEPATQWKLRQHTWT